MTRDLAHSRPGLLIRRDKGDSKLVEIISSCHSRILSQVERIWMEQKQFTGDFSLELRVIQYALVLGHVLTL